MHSPKRTRYVSAAIYAGSSSPSSNSNTSIREQVVNCWNCSSKRGWKIKRIFIDLEENRNLTDRTNFQKMVKEARTRRFDIVVLCKLEHLCGSPSDLANATESLRQLGIPFHYVRK